MTEPQFVEDVTELNSWKQQAAAGSASDTVVLRKQFISDVQVHGDRSIKFIITTGDADRENDVIDPTGWDVSNYLKNPVVLFAHDYGSLPIARTTKLEQHDDHLVAIAEFATEDLNPMAEQVFNMLKQGFLRGASVGFRPTVFEYNNDRGGVDFSGQELLEFSVVPIPANAQSLMAAGVKEKDVSCIKQWAEKTLEVLSETKQPISDQLDDFLDVIRKQMNDIKVSVKETVRNVDEFQNSFQYSAPRSLSSSVEKGISPRNVSEETAPMDTPWSRPNLGDFVDEPWESLSATQKTKIAGHYAWATAASPDTFGDMKLPHHRADDGYVVWRGVVAAAGRLDQTNFPSEDMNAVKRHLANHFKEFDREAPWERDAVSWSKYLRTATRFRVTTKNRCRTVSSQNCCSSMASKMKPLHLLMTRPVLSIATKRLSFAVSLTNSHRSSTFSNILSRKPVKSSRGHKKSWQFGSLNNSQRCDSSSQTMQMRFTKKMKATPKTSC